MKSALLSAVALSLVANAQSTTQSCIQPSGSIKPSVASGYRLQVVATGLASPRGLAIDSQGHILVVEAGAGRISSHTVSENGGCVNLGNARNITPSIDLNHGIQISGDGNTLYASNIENVFSWGYNATEQTVSDQTILIQGMDGSDHSTRTLQLSQQVPGTLIVSRGSTENLDYGAASVDSGLSQIRAFDLNARGDRVYNYSTDGTRLGWGLRNSVGVAEHPTSAGIWSVENSADNIIRDGVQVNQDNPAEEMNYHGKLQNNDFSDQGGNYGYPWCFAVWQPSQLPDSSKLAVGDQFALSQSSNLNNDNQTDEYCKGQVSPRLSFQAHMAPLDIKFNNSGQEAWISFHGSWNRDIPVGYKVSMVKFENGQPSEPASSNSSLIDIVQNSDDTVCPRNCFRPAGVVIDSQGRVYFSSDASGEIYLITAASSTSTPSGTLASTSTTPSPTQSPGLAAAQYPSMGLLSTLSGLLVSLLMWL